MTAAALARKAPPGGLQPVQPGRDLGQIADLVELCFRDTLDEGGRAAVREMRALGRLGPLVWLLSALTRNSPAWNLGFVWLEDGRVVGNVGLQRSGRRAEWLIANVAVHPDYRRRGIGRALTRAAMDLAHRQGGSAAVLQVTADNQAALSLYAGLDFQRQTTRTTWTRRSRRLPGELPSEFALRPRRAGEWEAQYDLASLALPHGLTWNRPLTAGDFRPSPGAWLERFFNGQQEKHWLALHAADASRGRARRLAGSLSLLTNTRGRDRLVLLVHPDVRGRVEGPLLAHALRHLGRSAWPTHLEYPAGDEAAEAVFKELEFVPERTLVWMKATL